jgi:presenilin-like A22 family membrane protease
VQKMLSTFFKMLVQHFSETIEFSLSKEMFGSILFQKILVQFFLKKLLIFFFKQVDNIFSIINKILVQRTVIYRFTGSCTLIGLYSFIS